jgi:hypothetical protein
MPAAPVIIKRVIYSMLVGLLIGAAINEFSFLFLRDTARPPRSIELVIPQGTSERVARGEAPPSIPDSMTFVVGDVLVVINEDVVDHQLGPLWIPSGTSASLALNEVISYSYECSFQPGNYFGLDVHEPLTTATRIYGILYAGLPLGVLIAIYSLIMPSKEKKAK